MQWLNGSVRTAWRVRAFVLTLTCFMVILLSYAGALQWVCDDAYISFRYAQNFAQGHGLVYNIGERVEGYTNFLWVVELAALHLITGLSFALISQALSVTMTLGVFVLILRLARHHPVAHRRAWVALFAVGFWALNRNVALWTTSGLETRQFTFLLLIGVVLVTEFESAKSRLGASLALAAAALTRPEGLMLGACFIFWEAVRKREEPTRKGASVATASRVKLFLALTIPFVLIVASHYLFRHSYYGWWLPNTYYAKVVRPWPEAGFVYLGAAFLESGLYATVPFLLLGFFARRVHRCTSEWFLFLCLLVPHMAYLVKVGGDHFEYRPLDFYFPLLSLMAAEGVVFAALLLRLFARKISATLARSAEMSLAWSTAALLLAYGVVIQTAEYSLTYNDEFTGPHVKADISEKTFPVAFILPWAKDLIPLYNDSTNLLLKHAIAVKWREHQQFSIEQQKKFGSYRQENRRKLPADAVMAYPYAGILPFSLGELTIIDTLGLTDATVARHGSRPNDKRIMAHDRSPPHGYLESRGVNLEVLPATTNAADALELGTHAAKLGEHLWMPFNTEKPDWAASAFADYSLMSRPDWSAKGGRSRAIAFGRAMQLKSVLANFESDNGFDWKLEGSFARRSGAVSGQGPILGVQGKGHLGSYSPLQAHPPGDEGEGVATSPEFQAASGDMLYLLIAGGNDAGVGVELLANGKRVQVIRGKQSESFRPVWIDLTAYEGQMLELRAFDQSRAGYAHVLLDQVAIFGAAGGV